MPTLAQNPTKNVTLKINKRKNVNGIISEICLKKIQITTRQKSTKFLNRTKEHFATIVVPRGLNPLKKETNLLRITKKLNAFYNFDFKTYVAELKKQKVTLSLMQQDEWQDYFDAYKTEINQLQNEINKTDNEIDQMVYKLYKLTPSEIEIIENSTT